MSIELITPSELATLTGLPRDTLARRLAKSLKPVYSRGEGRGRVVIYNQAEAEGVAMAMAAERQAAERQAAEPPDVPAQPEIGDVAARLAQEILTVQSSLDQIGDAVERADERSQQAQRALFAFVEKNLVPVRDMQEAIGHKIDGFLKGLALTQCDLLKGHQATAQEVTNLGAAVNSLAGIVERLAASVAELAARPQDQPQAVPNLQPEPQREAPAERAKPAAKTRPKTAVIYGLLDSGQQRVRQEIGDSWSLHFFGDSIPYDDAKIGALLAKSEALICTNSFRGKGPESVAKKAGVPCVRVAGVNNVIDELIRRL
jgi:hypothetical protein